MSVLIIAEHHQGHLADNVAQLVTAAGSIGGQVDLLLLGQGLTEAGEQAAALGGVDKVLLAEHPCWPTGCWMGSTSCWPAGAKVTATA